MGVHCHDELRVSDKQRAAIAPKMPSEVFPEYILIRVNDFNTVAKTPLEEWVNYLKNGVIDEHTTAPGLREARKKLQYYAMPEKEQAAYRAHLLDQMVQNDEIDSAKEEGRIEGRAEGRALPFIHIFDNPQHLTFAEEIVKSCFESCISWT